MLDKDLTFFLAVRDGKTMSNHSMPNVIAGEINTSIDMLKTSFFSKDHDTIPFKLNLFTETAIFKSLAHSRGVVEFSVRPVQELPEGSPVPSGSAMDNLNYEQMKENIIKKAVNDYTVNLANVPEKEKWDILSKELTQKQEIIHRMMKEVDDKTESLKLTGAEIVELRKQIKLLQNENQILRRRLGQEEQMQIESLVTQEIHKMSLPELKSKIIKLAQAYRGERLRNEEFEKALRQAQNEIANARKLANDLEQLQKIHEEDSEKYLNLQKETQKIGLYRETIKKQEEVITKMEGLLKKTMYENERQKDSLLELEQLRTENLKLQKEIKDFVVNSTPGVLGRGNIELEKSKKEINRLQTIIKELQNDLNNKRPISAEKKELQNEILELEVKYQKANARISSLQKELESSAKNYAKEIAALKLILAEKEALIENMRAENSL
jgi:DNA repair exonuclease SbcCD ATPase subunit